MTTRARKALDDAMSEAELQAAVIRLAHDLGWRVTHSPTVQTRDGRHRTAIHGDPGAPDLLMARRGVVLHAELKREGRYPDPRQRAWAEAIGETHRMWRPGDMSEIVATLRGLV